MDPTRKGLRGVTADLFREGTTRAEGREPLTVFYAQLVSREQTNWRELFNGFDHLKAITYSSGLEAILQLAEMFSDVEITFGSERILSREHAALEQVTQVAEGYTFVDAVADQKAFIEKLAAYLGKSARGLLPRVLDGSLRFQVLRKMPSHEKLYLLSAADRFRVITGSANLSVAALSGWQKEMYIAFNGENAYREFELLYQRDLGSAAPIKPEYLVEPANNGTPLEPRSAPVPLTEVPCVQVLSSGITILEERPKLPATGLTSEALRAATLEGTRLRGLQLDRAKDGRIAVTANSFFRALKAHQTAPTDGTDDRIARAEIILERSEVYLDGVLWLGPKTVLEREALAADARLIVEYLSSFGEFFGNAESAIRGYWMFLCWLYAAPVAPWLRQAAIIHSGDPLAYPVFGILYGRPNGGKSWFCDTIANSMFGGVWKQLRGASFTANRALGLREQLGAVPLVIDDVNRDRFTREVPDLVKFDRERAGQYAPIVISTNKQVSAVSPDIRKRAVACLIDAAIPDRHSRSFEIAHRAHAHMGTTLYKVYLQKLLPLVSEMRAAIADKPLEPPDLLAASSRLLREVIGAEVKDVPGWLTILTNDERLAMNDRPLLDHLNEIWNNHRERIDLNRASHELIVNFGGDNNQASNFEKLVPAFAFKRRFADTVTVDLEALEKIYGPQQFSRRRGWLRQLFSRSNKS
jgi:hypothetical protein